MATLLPRRCEQCGVSYQPRRRDQRFDRRMCQQRYRNAHRPKRPIFVRILRCDLCGVPNSERRVLRFSLRQSVRRNGRQCSMGVGTVFLCATCWAATAGRRRKLTGPRPIIETQAS